jgi:hypothetical protein
MSKLSLAVLCALVLSIGTAWGQSGGSSTHAIKVGNTYQAWFSPEYISSHSSMGVGNQYYIQIDAIDSANTNWVLVEFPPAPNQSYNSSLAGKRWINLNYVMELQIYTPPATQ